MHPVPVVLHEVWGYNLHFELSCLYDSLRKYDYRVASFDTEFPGTVYTMPSHVPKHEYASNPKEYYAMLKKNTDVLQVIQLGLTLCDMNGHMFTWNFNFSDFDPAKDMHNPDSIKMLCSQGINFSAHKAWGIGMRTFVLAFKPILEMLRMKKIAWVTFQGSYDYALLIKNLRGMYMPDDAETFMKLVDEHFGNSTFDLKLISRSVGIHGGLEKVAKQLGLSRVTGMKHQAGSDSLLVMQVFLEIYNNYPKVGNSRDFTNKLYGLSKPQPETSGPSSSRV